ncbi:MAG: hypothetical protein AAF993_00025 [Pseudomonadota bacterium]
MRSEPRVPFFAWWWVLLVLAGCQESATTSDATTISSLTFAAVPGDDAPELAHPGPYRVGVRTYEFAYPQAPDVSVASVLGADFPRWTRQLSVDVLYPAQVPDQVASDVVYQGQYHTGLTDIQGLPDTFQIQGLAVRDAPVVENQQFPLVIVSHGLLNSPGVLSGITENLASKGYVVAVIDHRDAQDEPATPVHLFARVLLNRVLDQQRILQEMRVIAGQTESGGQAPPDSDDLGHIINLDAIGLMGFSMGGYGVLGHAGAGFDPEGGAFDIVPSAAMAAQLESAVEFREQDRSHIDAVIAFAPWGGKPDDVWSDTALANVRAPLLVFAGDQDDVSDYELGIRRIFKSATGADRYLLVYQNAQHNLVQVPAPPSAHLDVRSWMTFEDPTWRRERLLSVGAHFVAAFLDWHLKGIAERSSYFDVPSVLSNNAEWPQSFGADFSDQYADGTGDSEQYWKGFKRRQAIGLELHHLPSGS